MVLTNQKFPSFHFRKEMASSLATLVVSKNSDLNTFPPPLEIHAGSEVSVGRASSCDLVIPDVRALSHVHCYVRSSGQYVELKSVSSNETLVDGHTAPKDQWVRLHDGSSITLSKNPKVKLGLKIGEMSKSAEKKRRTEAKQRINAIAQVTSTLPGSSLKYFVAPQEGHSSADKVVVTIGRSKECNIRLGDSKISSVHCKLTFSRKEGESVHWSISVDTESRNKTYVGTHQVEEGSPYVVDSFTDPLAIHLVFPPHKNPVETLVVTPLMIVSAPDSPESSPEDKRQKKEARAFEKQSSQWQRTYNEEVRNMIELENRLMSEIDSLEIAIRNKQGDIVSAQQAVETKEKDMSRKEEEFVSQVNAMKEEHATKLTNLTESVNKIVARLAQLKEQKLELQLVSSAAAENSDKSDD
jgi:pSer/pThr/pTyr-binding forkhead associated (FHA) protein